MALLTTTSGPLQKRLVPYCKRQSGNDNAELRCFDELQVIAACYDNPIPGYGTNTVGNLRLWESRPVTEFKLDEFNEGHYVEVTNLRISASRSTGLCPAALL